MAEVCGNISDNVPSEIGFEDSGDIDSEESMDSTDGLIVFDDGQYVFAAIQTEGIVYDKEKVEELEEKVSTLTQQLQELESRSQLKQATVESQNDSLSQEVQEMKGEIDWLRGQLKEKHKSITALQKRVKELQTQVDQLKCKIISYECDRDRLYLCQVAVEFERALCSHVIPEVFSRSKNTSSAKLDSLLNILNSGDEGFIPLNRTKHNIKAVLGRARQRWEKVCEDLQLPPEWKTITGKEINFTHHSVPRIFRAMAILKEERNPVAHPNPVSLQEAEKRIKATSIQNDLEDWEFDLVEEFISSLRTSIRRSGIQTDQSRLKL